MKKVLSMFLSVIMAFSCMTLCFSASAADGCVTLSVNGTQNGAIVQQALESINAARAGNGYGAITADAALTQLAEQRAAEIMISADSNDAFRPDGSSVSTYVPGYGSTADTLFSKIYTVDAASLESSLYKLKYSDYANIKSIGLSLFTYGETSAYYAIVSLNSAASPAALTTRTQTYTVNVAVSKFSQSRIAYEAASNNRYFILSAQFYADGLNSYYVNIPAAQVRFKSSNAKIFKIVGNNGYPKKDGKFTVTATLTDGTQIASDEQTYDGFNKVKLTFKSVKSPKKKTIKASWYQNITDADGYEFQYSTSKKFKKAKTVTRKGKKRSSVTVKKLKSKKYYYVRVRAYIDQGNGERAYSQWSAVKKIKVR